MDETLANELDDEAEKLITRQVGELREHWSTSTDAVHNAMAATGSHVVQTCAECSDGSVELVTDELVRIAQAAGRRAKNGLPFKDVLDSYVQGFEDALQRLTISDGTTDQSSVLVLTQRILHRVGAITGAVALGYVDGLRSPTRPGPRTHRDLVAALLGGASADHLARAAGIQLASNYLLVNLSIGRRCEQPTNETDVALDRSASQRLLSIFNSAADRHRRVLAMVGDAGGILLIPTVAGTDWARWSDVIAQASKELGVPITAAAATTTPSGVPAAAAETSEVLDVLRWFGRTPGLYQLDDVLVEYQLTRPGNARTHLAALIEPLRQHRELFDTLTHYVDCGLNRRRTATQLHLHPNTVDYRLRSIAKLTGINPTQSAGISQLIAAVAAHRAEGG